MAELHQLPHPERARIQYERNRTQLPEYLRDATDTVVAISVAGCAQGLFAHSVTTDVAAETKAGKALQKVMPSADFFTRFVGSLLPVVLMKAHFTGQCPTLQVDSELLQRLNNTDIDKGMPVSMLTPPYDRCYVRFGKGFDSGLFFTAEKGDRQPVDGCYIESSGRYGGHKLEITFCTQPPQERPVDDYFAACVIDLADSEMSLDDALTHTWEQIKPQSGRAPWVLAAGHEDDVRKACALLGKVLLYINCPSCRKERREDKAAMLKRLAGIKSPRKADKVARQSDRLYDYILITGDFEPSEPSADGGSAGRHVTAHWRRGHFRNQPHGEGRKLRRPVWIQPILVAGVGAAVKDYRVR